MSNNNHYIEELRGTPRGGREADTCCSASSKGAYRLEAGIRRAYASSSLRDLYSALKAPGVSDTLSAVTLKGCHLSRIPEVFFKLRALQVLELPRNELSEIPSGLAALTELRVLDLSQNRITSVSLDLSRLRYLATCLLYGNLLRSFPFRHLARMPALRSLDLAGNYLDPSTEPPEIQSLMQRAALSAWQQFVPQELIPNLYIGGVMATGDATIMRSLGLRRVISVGERPIVRLPEIAYQFYDFHDSPDVDPTPFFEPAARFIDGGLSQVPRGDREAVVSQEEGSWRSARRRNGVHSAARRSSGVLVHCKAGFSRSAAMICAYLMAYHSMALEEALQLIVRIRSPACPNEGFLRGLVRFEAALDR